jgi:hypothetical protein
MSAFDAIWEYQKRGLTDHEALEYALDYISRQCDDTCFEDFLREELGVPSTFSPKEA